MEELLLTLAVILLALFLILPIVSLVLLRGARRRILALEQQSADLEEKLRWLYTRWKDRPLADPAAREQATPAAPAAVEPEGPTAPARPAASAVPEVSGGPGAEAPPGPEIRGAPTAEAPPGPEIRGAPARPQEPPPPRAPRPPAPPPRPAVPLEQRLATYFTRVGAGALVLGALYFYKYAVDNEWIGPTGRIALGAVAGLAALIFAEVIRPRTRPAFVHALDGVGLALLYITAYASAEFYHVVDKTTAFGATTVVLFLGAALAWRHRGEAVLVLVLLAGFANPVLLSTGQDRPLALFSYLLVLTSLALAVSLARGFQLAWNLALLGVLVLGAGWYDKFFAIFDHTGESWRGDVPPESLTGAYLPLARRAVPLLFTALFSTQWLGAAFVLRGRTEPESRSLTRFVKPTAVLGLLLLHAGLTALLYDHPLLLGGLLIAAGAASIAALGALEAESLLLLPMLAAFVMLLGLSGETAEADRLPMLALLGGWTGVYLLAFVRRSLRGDMPARTAVLSALPLFAFECLAAVQLFPEERFIVLVFAVAGAAAGISILAVRARQGGLLLASLLFGLALLSAAGAQIPEGEVHASWPFLGGALAFALAHAAAAALMERRTREQARWGDLLSFALAPLAFLVLGLVSTSAQAPVLRALVSFVAGALALAAAGGLHSRTDLSARARGWRSTLAALALGLFAAALAFALSGATITVAWALLTLVALLILSESREPVWLAVAGALAAATLFRVFGYDLEGVRISLAAFRWSGGRQGALSVPAFLNARAYAFGAAGLCLLGGAAFLSRAREGAPATGQVDRGWLQLTAAVFAAIGYALLTALLVMEVRTALLELPPAPPMLLDEEEFAVFLRSVTEAESAQRMLLAMSTTLILAAVAMALLGAGFAVKDPFHRWLGLVLFLGTTGKLVLWDVWNLPRIYQVVVLVIVGALLLASGFLYARLKALFKGEVAAAALLLLGLARPAHAEGEAPRVRADHYASAAELGGVDGAGDWRFTITPALYARSLSSTPLQDLRIRSADGREVPFVLRPMNVVPEPRWLMSRVFDPGELPGGGYRATFELLETAEHCQVELELSSQGSFLRRATIETGQKPGDLQLVARGAFVFSVRSDAHAAESFTLRYPPSLARYVRVSLAPDPSAELTTIRGARFTCRRPEAEPPRTHVPVVLGAPVAVTEPARATVYELDLGQEGVPIDRLHLESSTPEFVRRVEVAASAFKSVWPLVATGVIYRVDGDRAPAALTLDLPPTRKRWLRLTLLDGDDAPVRLEKVEASLRTEEIVFRARSGGPHAVLVGDKEGRDGAPSYDLASILERRDTALAPREASLAAPVPNPELGRPQAAPELPVTERHQREIGWALLVVVLGLAAWAVRLIRAR